MPPDPDETDAGADEDLDRELDEELEDTFPASDPPEVLRRET